MKLIPNPISAYEASGETIPSINVDGVRGDEVHAWYCIEYVTIDFVKSVRKSLKKFKYSESIKRSH